jgi:hypothetical protein
MPLGTKSKAEIERMLKNSQTKVIVPVITLGLVREYVATKQTVFTDNDVRKIYEATVRQLREFLGHDLHIGAKYYDAYSSRMSRYGVLKQVGHLKFQLIAPYTTDAKILCDWIPERIKQHIADRLGAVPLLKDSSHRAALAEQPEKFLNLIREQIDKTPANFEIFSFAVLKVHLEKFACKIYRDTRTAAHDKGVDLSTNFGVVYQIKKLQIKTQSEADRVYAELKLNFDSERLQDGHVILIIDDISKEIKQFLINMKVQSISKDEVLNLAANFIEPEDRQKVLRVVSDEFGRDYLSRIS